MHCVRNSYGQALPADSLAKYYDMSLEQLQALKGFGEAQQSDRIAFASFQRNLQ